MALVFGRFSVLVFGTVASLVREAGGAGFAPLPQAESANAEVARKARAALADEASVHEALSPQKEVARLGKTKNG